MWPAQAAVTPGALGVRRGMTITTTQSGTNVHEIAAGILRISTPIPPSVFPGGFTFNQMLIVDDAPLLFHTGPRAMFPLVQGAVAHILGDVGRLRYVGFSHIESDECGSMNAWLAAAPAAEVVCSRVAVMTSADLADRAPRALGDGSGTRTWRASSRSRCSSGSWWRYGRDA